MLPSIRACPALRAPRPDPRVTPARCTSLTASLRKERKQPPSFKSPKARTHDLIDAIVYRLYGLMEVEIGIVEGRTYRL